MTASGILKKASELLEERGKEYDTEGQERSMSATVAAFNAMFSAEMTVEQGWHFMVLLKMARCKGNRTKLDNYLDGAAYFALAGER